MNNFIAKIKVIVDKLIIWIKMNGATACGLIQAVLKALKETATGLINLFSIFVLTAPAEALVLRIRAGFEVVDGWVEIVKAWLLQNVE